MLIIIFFSNFIILIVKQKSMRLEFRIVLLTVFLLFDNHSTRGFLHSLIFQNFSQTIKKNSFFKDKNNLINSN